MTDAVRPDPHAFFDDIIQTSATCEVWNEGREANCLTKETFVEEKPSSYV